MEIYNRKMALGKNLKFLTQFKKPSTAEINGWIYAGSSISTFKLLAEVPILHLGYDTHK